MARLNKVQMKPEAILIDTREDLPYPSQIGTVPIPDHWIIELEHCIAREGKKLNDPITPLAAGRKQFEMELCKDKLSDHFALVTEVNLSHLDNARYRSRMKPSSSWSPGCIARGSLRVYSVNASRSCKKRLSKTVNN
ncbi:MAG: hypothetical protein KAV87_02235 [Desulfobacteraceae bacterium]|nr:hypothetical protein [Desulfobacteraceae bacterium]